eukprot:GHVS01064452.1.p1 GENE.GHVS01064452.1~~GHVS01064452.1.p1  ORF type:complete len:211 (+),score=15.48 GHVS01064452.1:380-1012(+)
MNGFQFVEASFPQSRPYRVVQRTHGSPLTQLRNIEQWAPGRADQSIVQKAYWVARSHSNCELINRSLLSVLKSCESDCVVFGERFIEIKSLSLRTLALTPFKTGILVEPPFTTTVPSSSDGEVFHTFVVGADRGDGTLLIIDASCAKFGVFGPNSEPFVVEPLVPFLKKIGQTRELTSIETYESNYGFVEFMSPKLSIVTSNAKTALGMK